MTASDDIANAEEPQDEDCTTAAELRAHEKKAFLEFKDRVQEAILNNHLFPPPSDKENLPNSSPENVTQMPESSADTVELNSEAEENATDISLWGVPLLPSEGHEETDTILLKFLRARDFRVPDAFDMLCKTLRWRKEYKIDGILDEEAGSDLQNVVYMDGTDKKGHPLYYNIYGAFKDKNLYRKTFGTEEKCDKFMRWRIQIMEKGIRNLSFKPGGVCSMVQIIDLKNVPPGPSMKDLQSASRKAVAMLQDNYPEFLDKNIFINVPFWYYASHTVFSRVLTQRTKSKFIFARPAKVTETLLKYIDPENIPIQYGGLKRENDAEFSHKDAKVSEMTIRGGGIGTIEIPVAEQGVTAVWEMTVVGWDVTYREEFIPDDDCSYKILIKREKKVEEILRNSFYINEPGKIVLTIENRTYKRKKVCYRSKIKPTDPSSNFFR